jgi:hypothetical protein
MNHALRWWRSRSPCRFLRRLLVFILCSIRQLAQLRFLPLYCQAEEQPKRGQMSSAFWVMPKALVSAGPEFFRAGRESIVDCNNLR